MSPTETLAQHQQTGLSDSSHRSTSSSAEKYRLDEFDTRPILLYKYRGGLQTSSQKDLCAWLDKGEVHVLRSRKECPCNYCCECRANEFIECIDETLRVTRKAIPRYTSYVDVKRHDLYLPEEKERYANYPNYDSNLASIKVPSLAYWNRLFLGKYQELYIVSPESSPNSSQADEDSRQTSPTNTWNSESSGDAQLGASQESHNEE